MRLFSIGNVDFAGDIRRMFAFGVEFIDDQRVWIVFGCFAFGIIWDDIPEDEPAEVK